MKCPKPALLSRALVEGLSPALQAHVDVCPSCSALLATDADIAASLRELPVTVPDASRAANVRAALLMAARSPAPLAIASRPWRAWLLAGGTMLAAAAVLLIVVTRPSPPSSTATYHASILPHPGAALLRTTSAPDETVRLIDGSATFTVAALSPGERFRVITSDAEIEVRGTAFDVDVANDHLMGVRVVQGHVEVRAYGSPPRRLGPGERWEIKLASNDAAERSSAPANAPANASANAMDSTAANNAVASGANNRVAPHGTGTPTGTASRTPTGASVTGTSSKTAKTPAGAPSISSSTTSTPPKTPRTPAGTPSISSTAGAPPNAQARPKRQIELLFEQGWGELAAGKATDAATSFERAAKAAPDDPLAEDAWFWRASALARAKSSTARGALESFLSHYPRSPRVGEASAMLGWLVMDADLDRAEQLFHVAEKDRVAAVRASAAKGLAAVAQRRQR